MAVNGLGAALAPGHTGNAMVTAKCLAGSLAEEEAPAQNPGVSLAQARVSFKRPLQSESSGCRR